MSDVLRIGVIGGSGLTKSKASPIFGKRWWKPHSVHRLRPI